MVTYDITTCVIYNFNKGNKKQNEKKKENNFKMMAKKSFERSFAHSHKMVWREYCKRARIFDSLNYGQIWP